MKKLSPIVLFTYLRFEKLQQTITELSKNFLASNSDLIIYSDGPKNSQDQKKINQIRTYLKTVEGFKSIVIHESPFNLGLSKSIIFGVSETIKKYKKVIVLEDDLIVSRNFLCFMNEAIDKYINIKEVYSISGYSILKINKVDSFDGYFLNRSWSWGWAIWEDRWDLIDWQLKFLKISNNFNKKLPQKLNTMGDDLPRMFNSCFEGYSDSWYIRFLINQYQMNGLTIYPIISKVLNNGFDEFATHNKGLDIRFKTQLDKSYSQSFILPEKIKINHQFQNQLLVKFNFKNRLINKLKEIFYHVKID